MNALELKVPPAVIPALSVVLMYVTRDLVPRFGMSPTFINLIGGFVFFSACVFMFLGIWEFKRIKTTVNPMQPENTSSIVNTGVFQVSRNPMYLGFVLMVAAAGILLQHSAFIVFCIATFFYIQRFQIIPEERILADKFGEPYLMYCQKVARWF